MKKYFYAAFLLVGLAALLMPPQAFAQEEKPFTIHGEVRFRAELQNNGSDFADTDANISTVPGVTVPGGDDSGFFWPYRARIAAEGRFTKNITGWVEFQQAGVGGEDFDGPRFNGDRASDVHLYQGYVTLNQLWSKNFSLRFGRSEMVLGNEFLMGDADFYAGISYDGVFATWDMKDWDISGWWTRPVEGSVINAAGDVTPDVNFIIADAPTVDFFGGYATWNFGDSKKKMVLDVYLMQLNDRALGSRFYTLGGRWARDNMDKSSFFWNIEWAQQLGMAASELAQGGPPAVDIDASGMAVEGWFGYTFKGKTLTHRVWGRLEMATGDKTDNNVDGVYDTGDDFEGFIGLFPDFHNRAGRGDWFHVQATDINGLGSTALGNGTGGTGVGGVVGTGGLFGWAVGYTGYYGDRHEFGGAFWDFTSETEVDIDPTAAGVNEQDGLGQEWDLWYGFNYSKNVTFLGSWSMLSPGDLLTQAVYPPGGTVSADDDVMRLYGQVRLRF